MQAVPSADITRSACATVSHRMRCMLLSSCLNSSAKLTLAMLAMRLLAPRQTERLCSRLIRAAGCDSWSGVSGAGQFTLTT